MRGKPSKSFSHLLVLLLVGTLMFVVGLQCGLGSSRTDPAGTPYDQCIAAANGSPGFAVEVCEPLLIGASALRPCALSTTIDDVAWRDAQGVSHDSLPRCP